MIDVTERDLKTILALLDKHVPGCEVRAFGSRVAWTAKDHSDLDLVIVGPEKLERGQLDDLKEALAESSVPFRVDVMDWHKISTEFQENILKSFVVIKKPSAEKKHNWKYYKVSEFAEVIGGGTPKTSVAEYWNGNIPWITPKDLSSHKARYISKGERNISQEGLKNSGAQTVPPNTVLLTSRAPVGYLAIAKNELTTNQGFRSLVARKGFSSEFVYYLLLNNIDYLKQHASGSTFQELSGGTLKNLEFQIPDYATQLEIAKILGDLDAKIELNQQMNKTLEAMAQALFKEWFVDNADAKWLKGKLGDICERITKGTTPTTLKKNFTTTGINFIKVESIDVFGHFLQDKFAHIDNDTNTLLSRSIIQKDDILYTIAGTIGRVAVANSEILPANTNQAVAIIRLRNKVLYLSYVRLLLKTSSLAEKFRAKIVQAVQANLSLGEISGVEIRIPDERTLIEFNKTIDPIFLEIRQNANQIDILSQTRDSLLPKLMAEKI